MCNHKYTTVHKTHKKCPYPDLYSDLKIKEIIKENNYDLDIPLDNNGICLFHSNDLEWKAQNNFVPKFLNLIKLLDACGDCNKTRYDFAEFVFVGKIKIENISLERSNFSGAVFNDRFELSNTTLKSIDFIDTLFKRGATIKKVAFLESVRFQGSIFEQGSSLEEVIFHAESFFEDSKFNDTVTFYKVVFESVAYFSGALFRTTDGHFDSRFREVKFNDDVKFNGCIFDCEINFERILFNSNSEFIDVYFSDEFPTLFGEIEVNRSLHFKSNNAEERLFNHNTYFRLIEDKIKGMIKFENANFVHIFEAHRKELMRLSKLGKVEIGSGCIKYRFQTEIKTFCISQNNQSLVLEISQTFINYFTTLNGFNLGLEVVERNEEILSFFYFTDENIDEDEFLDRLKNTEQNLWQLLSQTNETEETSLLVEEANTVINTIDGISALIGTFFRVGVRIAYGKWQQKDTEALVNVIKFDNSQAKFSGADLHKLLSNNYKTKNLLGINSNQNQNFFILDQRQITEIGNISNSTVVTGSVSGNITNNERY